MDSGRLADCAEELDRLADRLAECAMDVLRDAVDSGADDPDFSTSAAAGEAAAAATKLERHINRARSAVEKAAHLLRTAPLPGD